MRAGDEMEIDQIKQNLRDYIVERFAVPTNDSEFSDDVHLFDYGYVDSFGAVELISFVQKTFGIEISQTHLMAYPLNTISEIATFVSLRKRGEL
jgi:D-alanine--poly(phosphoribitol) ligase subunit 2